MALAPQEAGAPPAPPPMPMDGQTPPDMSSLMDASPEEQDQFEHFVAKAIDLIYDPSTTPAILDMLSGEGDPIEGLARAAALVVGRVGRAAEQAGIRLSPDVVLHAGKEVMEDLADLSRIARIHDFSEDPDGLEGAFFRGLDMFRTMLSDAEEIDQGAFKADMQKLVDMDQRGDLEGMFRKLAETDAGAETDDEPAPRRRGMLNPDGEDA